MNEGVDARVATDIGGTFTDMVWCYTDRHTGRQRVIVGKASSTPPDFEQGVIEVLRQNGVTPDGLKSHIHGTTVVINAITERKGARVGLITSDGFRDALEIARGDRPDFFNLKYRKPPPFVPRFLRKAVAGRIDASGQVRIPLRLDELPAILAGFQQNQVEAVAVCLLNSYANPTHEREVVREIRRLWPSIPVVASTDITREWREYERTSTTALCAYVQPITERYLTVLSSQLQANGYRSPVYVMQSNGGMDSLQHASTIPITIVESGPASGFLGCAEIGKLVGIENIIALDVGGTTAKCCLIEGGRAKVVTNYAVDRSRRSSGYPITTAVVDLVEIGNGGGSIAWADALGKLHVGPRSAAAVPGPIAYGKGGTEPTTTDANLVLGRISPALFHGSNGQVDPAAVAAAFAPLASRLAMTPTDLARGIVRIANNNMVNALKLVSVNRVRDPRDYTLAAFGGGGGLHAAALARELGIKRVLVPRYAEVFSAWGMLLSDMRRDYFVSRVIPMDAASIDSACSAFDQLRTTALAQLSDEGLTADRISFQHFGKLRYVNQEHDTEVLLDPAALNAASVASIRARFQEEYEREYTYTLDAEIEFVGVHLVAFADVGKVMPERLDAPPTAASADPLVPTGNRMIDFDTEGTYASAVHDGSRLPVGARVTGPAVIETAGSSVLIYPGDSAEVDSFGNLQIAIGGDSA